MKPLEDIAVTGLACLFPGAPDLGTFWQNILAKVDAISDPPPEAWDPSLYFDAEADENDRVYCKKGGYLGPLALFDPLDHGIVPRAVEGGEPDQWLALHVARAALRDAGYEDLAAYRERAALILGKGTYANRGTMSIIQHTMLVDTVLGILKAVQPALDDEALRRIRADLKRRLPRFDAETAPALVSNVTVGRIANRLDVMGPSYTVDAACASSLVAVDIAVKGLRQGEYDVALVGGLQAATPHAVLGLFCQLKALSPTGRIRPFARDADGTLLSEGLGMALLKRRSQAERDGDRIYAVVKGTGVASDGRAVGVLAPRVEGEELALRRAYDQAGVAPGSVELVEAHGTGTPVGDAVEVEALRRVFGEPAGRPRCAIGSVKSMIGHTMPAAGMAGFIKSALALHHRVLPPTINVSEPSPRLVADRSPFYVNTETRPWIHGDATAPRRAGVNAFGFGGINAHVVLEERDAADLGETHEHRWDSEVCLVAGESRAEVLALARQVRDGLARQPDVPLADVARAVNMPPRAAARTLGIVAETTADLSRKLERAIARLDDPSCRRIKESSGIYFFDAPLGGAGTLAFLFPGEGSQYPYMLGDLCRHFPAVRACFDRVDGLFARHARGYLLSDVVYPAPELPGGGAGADRGLTQMDIAVEAVLTANHALYTLLRTLGVEPDAVLGHSTGEHSALQVAGVYDTDEEQRTIDMNELYLGAIDGGRIPPPVDLLAIGAGRPRVDALCAAFAGVAALAMDNCPHQVVLAVDQARSAAVQARCRAEGLLYERLPFDRPYHTPLFDAFAGDMRRFFRRWVTRPPAVPLYSCTTMGRYPADLDDMRRIAVEHWVRPVEFRRTVENMYADGIRLFLEVGARGNLTAFVGDTLGQRDHAAIPVNVARRSGITQLHHAIAQLAGHGVRPDLSALYARRRLGDFDWTAADRPRAAKRPLGRVQIPTGAPEMRLSAESVAAIRRTFTAALEPAVTTVGTGAPDPTRRNTGPEPPVAAAELAAAAAAPRRAPSRRAPVAPAPAPEAVGTATAVSAFFGTMDEFLSLQQHVMQSVLMVPERSPLSGAGPGTLAASGTPAARWPLLGAIVSVDPGAALVARSTIDLDTHPFLRDHTLGRDVSRTDAGLTGMPIVPFTALVETMAEAASALVPGRVVVGLSDVRVARWLAVGDGPLVLEIRAERADEGGEPGDAAVRVRVIDTAARELGPAAEGMVRLRGAYPEPPLAEPFDLSDAVPGQWAPGRLYETAMFHGPAFRGVRSVDAVGAAGATASLEVLDRQGLLGESGADARLVTDFVLLDQPGQVVGFWAAQRFDRGFFVLPHRLRALHLYAPPLPAGERLTCVARIAAQGEHEISSTLDVVRSDGRLCARFVGWDDRRFDLPAAVPALLVRPDTVMLSEPWPVPGAGEAAVRRVTLDAFPRGWFDAFGGLWRRVLAALVLGRRERAIWRELTLPEARRLQWLLGRIAAKDAVRDYLRRTRGLDVRSADVEILPDASGRPVVDGCFEGPPPIVSISHVDGTAIAIAGDGAQPGIGIDLERASRMTRPMEEIAFSPGERALLGAFDGAAAGSWPVRVWCAKEAVVKAMGGTAGPLSRSLVVARIERDRGTVLLRYVPPEGAAVECPVATAQEGDWIVATYVGQSPGFVEGAQ